MKTTFILYITVLLTTFMLYGCATCKPDESVSMLPFGRNMVVKGFDTDCDSDIDYWQYFTYEGKPVGSRIYTIK